MRLSLLAILAAVVAVVSASPIALPANNVEAAELVVRADATRGEYLLSYSIDAQGGVWAKTDSQPRSLSVLQGAGSCWSKRLRGQ